jgi:hypothetical protein
MFLSSRKAKMENTMSDITISGDIQEISHEAGSAYNLVMSMSPEDVQSSRLSYLLLRLSSLGLTEWDQVQLLELARFAFQELDVTEAVHRIRDTESASPLAVAIASIVLHAQPSKKMAMLGAVFGAYAGCLIQAAAPLKAS